MDKELIDILNTIEIKSNDLGRYRDMMDKYYQEFEDWLNTLKGGLTSLDFELENNRFKLNKVKGRWKIYFIPSQKDQPKKDVADCGRNIKSIVLNNVVIILGLVSKKLLEMADSAELTILRFESWKNNNV